MNSELAFSAGTPAEFPADALPEIAVLGRSNVGKSSFINTLIGRRNLARTSGRPGRTRRIHFFRIGGCMYLVDLPGYGYAAVSRDERRSWRPMVESYLGSDRDVLRAVILLIDIRRDPGPEETQLMDFLGRHEIPLRVVLTKADKLRKSALAARRRELARLLGLPTQAPDTVSATRRQGFAPLATWLQDLTGAGFTRIDLT